MARPKKDQCVDLSSPIDLTMGVIERLQCPKGKTQAFLRDGKCRGLRVRVTAAGAKAFVYERKLKNRSTFRKTFGDVQSWSIEQAREEARRLAVIVDTGSDPREMERQRFAQQDQDKAAALAGAITFGEAWERYVAERKPYWGILNYADHQKIAQRGGLPRKRREGVLTTPGPLAPFLNLRLAEIGDEVIKGWAGRESVARPARVRLALRMLNAFFTWAASDPALSRYVNQDAARGKRVREVAGSGKAKTDYLQREQLSVWFEYVLKIENPVISAYLQALLLTGSRREELASIKWSDVNFRWKGITMKDKVEGLRVIPLTPRVETLLGSLPRRNEWVFSSLTSASGRLVDPSIAHRKGCKAAGLDLTLHGLRRSFKSLSEWLEIPVGVIAQIMGHKPSATAEKHYTIRPLDLLRVHHEKFEGWILQQSGIEQPKSTAKTELKIVA
jgi:integrase